MIEEREALNCTGCGWCQVYCDYEAIKIGMGGHEDNPGVIVIQVKSNLCKCCGKCIPVCPTRIISEYVADICPNISGGGGDPGGGDGGGGTGGGDGGDGGDGDIGDWSDPSQRTGMVKKAVKNAVKEMTDKYGYGKAVCNYGVQAAFNALFETHELDGKKANEIITYWQNHPESWEPLITSDLQNTLDTVQQVKNNGAFVVAGWQNPSGESGHVVVIVPGEMQSGWKNMLVPICMDTGRDMRSESQRLSSSFGVDKRLGIVFFKYK